ncbi:MAG: hypothetical protein WC869_02835 [Phycisphaerae bacterium]|jgi:hypothetical protein
MLEQALLREQFSQLLAKAQEAEQAYAGLIHAGVRDPHAAQELEQLLADKQRHVRLAQRLLEIVE